MLSQIIRRNGLKNIVAYYSSVGKATGRCLDQAINELNQELESIFGPSGDNEKKSLFSTSTSTLMGTPVNLHEHSGTTGQRVVPPQGMPVNLHEHSGTTGQRVVLPQGPPHSSTGGFSHVDAHGKASMVNVSEKVPSKRMAIASGKVVLGPVAFPLVSGNQISKGDVLTVAKIGGIYGAKQTGSLIPLCHNIALSNVQVNLELDEQEHSVIIKAEVATIGVTGVEMEALTAVSVAALTIYDMCKAVSKDIAIMNIQLEAKMGGKSGDWCRTQDHV